MILHQVLSDKAVTFAGASAATSIWWLPILKQWSEIAGLLLPIVGLALLTAQAVYKLRAWWNEK